MDELSILKQIIEQQNEIIRLLKNPMAGRYMTREDIMGWSPYLRGKKDFQEAEKQGELNPVQERPRKYLTDEVVNYHNKVENGANRFDKSRSTKGVSSGKQSILSTLEV